MRNQLKSKENSIFLFLLFGYIFYTVVVVVVVVGRDVLRTVGVVKDGPKVFSDTSDLGLKD